MQACKAFFRILWQQKITITIYIIIFLGLCIVFAGGGAQENEENYVNKRHPVAVFDDDQSEVSKALIEYISSVDQLVKVEDNDEKIMDEMYARSIVCVIRIPEGFGANFNTEKEKNLQIMTIPGTIYSVSVKNQISKYFSLLKGYYIQTEDSTTAIKKTEETMQIQSNVALLGNADNGKHQPIFYFYQYLPYILISVLIVGVGQCLIVMEKKEIQDRMNCSAYPIWKKNLSLLLSLAISGTAIVALLSALALVLYRGDFLQTRTILCELNMLSYTSVALAICFMVSMFAKGANILNMAGNVIGLGLSFIGGVFVPMEIMSRGIQTLAKFTPSYWYLIALKEIYSLETISLGDVGIYFLIQLGFAVTIVTVSLALMRMKRGK